MGRHESIGNRRFSMYAHVYEVFQSGLNRILGKLVDSRKDHIEFGASTISLDNDISDIKGIINWGAVKLNENTSPMAIIESDRGLSDASMGFLKAAGEIEVHELETKLENIQSSNKRIRGDALELFRSEIEKLQGYLTKEYFDGIESNEVVDDFIQKSGYIVPTTNMKSVNTSPTVHTPAFAPSLKPLDFYVPTMSELRRFLKEQDNKIDLTSLGSITLKRKPLGQGGNGLVLEPEFHGRKVAAKFLVSDNRITSKKLKRFKAEYVNIAFLPEQGFILRPIVYDEIPMFDSICPIILMPRLDGSLKELRAKEVPSINGLRKLLLFLVDSLSFIHKNGIVHRDLKPENILVKDDQFLLADFGIAFFDAEHFTFKADTQAGDRLANHLFFAPEQVQGPHKAHATMDIFAIGQLCQ